MTGQLDFSSVKIWPVIDTLTLTVKQTIRNLFRYIIVPCWKFKTSAITLEGMKMWPEFSFIYLMPLWYVRWGKGFGNVKAGQVLNIIMNKFYITWFCARNCVVSFSKNCLVWYGLCNYLKIFKSRLLTILSSDLSFASSFFTGSSFSLNWNFRTTRH